MIKQNLLINQEEREAFVVLLIELNDRYQKSKKTFKIVAIIGLIAGVFFLFHGSIIVPLVFVCHFFFFMYMSQTGLKKRMTKQLNKEFPEDGTLIRTYTLTDEGMSVRSKYGFDMYPWTSIMKAGKYYHYYYFYRSDGQVMLLDHRLLSEQDEQGVLDYIKKVEKDNGTK